MGHYDEYYYCGADSKQYEKKTQENCQHKWVPIECDEQCNTTVAKCSKCGKKMIKG